MFDRRTTWAERTIADIEQKLPALREALARTYIDDWNPVTLPVAMNSVEPRLLLGLREQSRAHRAGNVVGWGRPQSPLITCCRCQFSDGVGPDSSPGFSDQTYCTWHFRRFCADPQTPSFRPRRRRWWSPASGSRDSIAICRDSSASCCRPIVEQACHQ